MLSKIRFLDSSCISCTSKAVCLLRWRLFGRDLESMKERVSRRKEHVGTFISGMNATQFVQDPFTAIMANEAVPGRVLHAYAMQCR